VANSDSEVNGTPEVTKPCIRDPKEFFRFIFAAEQFGTDGSCCNQGPAILTLKEEGLVFPRSS